MAANPLQEAGLALMNAVDNSNDRRPQEADTESSSSQQDLHDAPTSPGCRWRTSQFYDQECLRFFDCPSHLVARRLSEVTSEDGPHILPEVTREDDDPNNLENDIHTTDNAESVTSQPQDRELPPTPHSPDTDSNTAVRRITPAFIPTRRDSQLGILRQPASGLGQESAAGQEGPEEQSRTNRRSVIITEPTEDLNALRISRIPSNHDSSTASVPLFVAQQRSIEITGDPHDSGDEEASTEFVLPRWQPDAEVTYCPICYNQFSIFVRKHHCRKCGRVVCASCSPHRIIIPYQYIVRAPGYELPASQNLLLDGLVTAYGLPGGERVRLCNPCVPDPNNAPPYSPSTARNSHNRSRSGTARAHGGRGRYSMIHTTSESANSDRYYAPRTRSITMLPPVPGSGSARTSHAIRHTYDRYRSGSLASTGSSSYPARVGSLSGASSSSRRRALPPRPIIAEEDECPVCHRELPSRSLPDFETLRENHITTCILEHSQYGNSPRTTGTGDRGDSSGEASSVAAPRRTGMYTYPATEKDCVDDAECTICLEEFAVGIPMARLECLCRFHRSCIAAWFVNHPGRCPVHQHDGFGY